jgi:lipopolysaccharide biosynthesis regulator YciM
MGKLYYRLEMIDDAFDTIAEMENTEERFPDLHKILGNIYVRRGQLDLAVEEFKKALNLKKMVVIPYYCPLCDFHTTEWAGRCQRCGEWNTYIATPILNQRSKVQPGKGTLKLSRVSFN